MKIIKGINFIGNFSSKAEIEKSAPREIGNIAQTDNAGYVYNGEEWLVAWMRQFITFKVLDRQYITGKGFITVIHNPDLLPIDCDEAAICKNHCLLPIHSIEKMKTLMTNSKVKPEWGLVTSEETIGDFITIKMYPDKY